MLNKNFIEIQEALDNYFEKDYQVLFVEMPLMEPIEGEEDYIDLWLMSLCKNNIIVNSSFSWWGAYLNKNVDKVVIAPSKWFGDGVSLSTEDIVPEQWNKI